ncbi:C3a anaphylatoxin chemotactic receptor-like [Anomaloglossus baeobatrachus]|uniref:C3a anaphylatoxin chemotactic receptor-like n=1 Tax=Anomaloglossus baeobatrachus TaxID=238106 RepID=UPI003F50BA0F
MKKTTSAVWFLHLAIADFLCCASLPKLIIDWSLPTIEPLFIEYCIVSIFLFNLNLNSSVLLVTAMSIDRWVSVMWPTWAKVYRTYNLARISAAIIWGLSLIVTILLFFLHRYRVSDLTELCRDGSHTYFDLPREEYTVRLFRLFTTFMIPFLIIITTYVSIFFKRKKSKRSQRSQRSSRIITAVIFCFFICWFPFYIFPLIAKYFENKSLIFTLLVIVTSLACINSCMNPIIYVIMGQGFFRSIATRVEGALSDPLNDLCREDTGNTHSTDV